MYSTVSVVSIVTVSGNAGISKNESVCIWKFDQNYGLKIFRYGTSVV